MDVPISEETYERLAKRAKHFGYASVDDYVLDIVRERVRER